MVCVDMVAALTIRTSAKTHSLLALTMIDPATIRFEIVEATSESATSIQDLLHNTWLARYDIRDLHLLSLIMEIWANSNMRSNKSLCKKIMAFKLNLLQVTTHKQMQSLSDYTKLSMGNNMLRSFNFKSIMKI
jgi:hypothetical protein